MDLADLSTAGDAVAMPLRDPASNAILETDGKPVTVSLIGRDHPDFQRHMRRKQDKIMAAATRETLTSEKVQAEYFDNLVALIRGWSGIVLDGKPLAFSPEAARKLVSDERLPWIAEQIDAFASARVNFVKASSPNS